MSRCLPIFPRQRTSPREAHGAGLHSKSNILPSSALRQKWSLTDSPFVARTGPAEPVRCYCVRNLYATIRATMLAKISSAERDFRIIGLVEWRAADRPG